MLLVPYEILRFGKFNGCRIDYLEALNKIRNWALWGKISAPYCGCRQFWYIRRLPCHWDLITVISHNPWLVMSLNPWLVINFSSQRQETERLQLHFVTQWRYCWVTCIWMLPFWVIRCIVWSFAILKFSKLQLAKARFYWVYPAKDTPVLCDISHLALKKEMNSAFSC